MLLLTLVLLAAPPDSAVVRDIEVAPGEKLRITTLGVGQPVVLIPGLFGSAFSYRTITGPLAPADTKPSSSSRWATAGLPIARPALVRGLLWIDGGPAESASTSGPA
jgi:hypothetical protein